MYQTKLKIIGLCLVALTLFIVTSTPFQAFASIPDEIRLYEGKYFSFPSSLPVSGEVASDNLQVVKTEENVIQAIGTGTTQVQVKVGNVPLKKVKVNVLPELKVYPGGQSIGVQLQSVGPLIVGYHFIDTEEGKISPTEQANIRIGDMIVKINGRSIETLEEISHIVNKAGENDETLNIELLRGKETLTVDVKPLYDKREKAYRLGAYIRNSAAGVGTLTFIHPETGAYGALGHVITDMDTQKPIVVGEGAILESNVSAIEKGVRGGPGEKLSQIHKNRVLGDVKKNTPFGIFGHMKETVKNGIIDNPIPVGLSEEVKKGPAQILTVVEGQKVEMFDIEIVEIMEQKFPATKGLIIKVTDPELLNKTGGIVQGMSGSPIIQDGKLIGAVTHVFVNDPTSGYGLFIEWMLDDAGLLDQSEQKPKAS
ncbi:stage IV sporulation protein B [Caldalkalibacillus thermarum TA2.A1]|uniref:SpoIVB peptidase n=1 Tax=Caldalkalibacillus thermarum (strain TA2.A1) TaxID=986075 RepID=F5L3H5_CALTT|nr:SpoIVB peptidase [Caldalkalibacillus thermarum]EGL84105.1 stage IV sporulation protein B [Caldalkalibacillus thermarum TA2.A1]QZT32663.1 SpoIVB peptidase [Caldalkalibacillus thermarum TA2.A1]